MPLKIKESWAEEMLTKMRGGQHIDVTTSYNKSLQWLIVQLSNHNIAYKVYNLGAGVKRVTTITDVCPCCKKTL